MELLDVDDTEALLAFVDDCAAADDCQRPCDTNECAGECSNDELVVAERNDAAVAVVDDCAVVPRVTRTPQINRGREKMRKEMAYLQRKVLHLEERLARLQRDQTAETAAAWPDSSVMDDSADSHASERAELWHRIAQRQLLKRERSEAENARLKEGLQSQIKLIRSLEKVLLKRSSSQLEDELLGCQREHKRMRGLAETNAVVLDDMLAKLDALYAEMDATFSRLGITDIEKTTSSACVQANSRLFPQLPMGICLEILDVAIYPFHFQAVANAMWAFREQITSDPHISRYTAADATPDTMAFSFEYSTMIGEREVSESGVQALRQYREENRVVLAWMRWSRPMVTSERPTTFEFVSQGWICVRPLSNNPESSVLQYFTTLVPRPQKQVDDTEADGTNVDVSDKKEVGAITEWVLDAFENGVMQFREAIEDILLQGSG